jgi:hypothetical protein
MEVMKMKIGDFIRTPRFCTVKINEMFDSVKAARAEGYTEPTHYEGEYEILGKHIGINRMVFAAVKK